MQTITEAKLYLPHPLFAVVFVCLFVFVHNICGAWAKEAKERKTNMDTRLTGSEQTGCEWNRIVMRVEDTRTRLHILTLVNYKLLAVHTSGESRMRRENFAPQIIIERDDYLDFVRFPPLNCSVFYLRLHFIHSAF